MISGIVSRLAFIAQLLPADQLALSDMQRQLSYRDLVDEINACVRWLDTLGARVIALHGQNSLEWVILDLACQQSGRVFVPLPTFFSTEQLRRCLMQAGVGLIVCENAAIVNALQNDKQYGYSLQPAEVWFSLSAWRVMDHSEGLFPDGTQKITFTSGSTGEPKGVCLSEQHQWQVAQSLADAIAIKHPRHLCVLPLSTLLENIAGVYAPLLCGGCVQIANDQQRGIHGSSGLNSPNLLACISAAKPTTMILTPQLLHALVMACQQGWRAPASLQFIAVGGARVAEQLISDARNAGLPVYQGYGLSECGSVVALNTPGQQRSGSVGKILTHCTVHMDGSNICVSGACHLGYLADTDSWYPEIIQTGDLGDMHDGFLRIRGREKNVLITSFGRNVSPEWVEAQLTAQPILSQCIVFGDGRAYLTALLSAPVGIDELMITRWVDCVNQRLPDYARVLKWQRLGESEFNNYITANGRLRRACIAQAFSRHIEHLYCSG